MKLLLLFSTLLTWLNVRAEGGAPLVSTEEGDIIGREEKAFSGESFNSYYGIPFAQPPTGDLRFKDPEPARKWDGVKECKTMPSPCVQVRFGAVLMGIKVPAENLDGTEDCLYLNVFTPKDAIDKASQSGRGLPVMAFIHGGGYFAGAADEYLPHVLLSRDVILVVIQYRLGFLGFLSTEDSVMPGNYGLKDQTLALQWVQRNIRHFGGDPKRVTIFGESAGGASVHFQMLAPKAKGLFNGAIAQSGTAFCPWAHNDAHLQSSKDAGAIVGCSLENGSKDFLKCMQQVDAKEINAAYQKMTKWFASPILGVPRIDGDFIPDHPAKLMKEGNYNKVNLMLGVTTHEGGIFSLPTFAKEEMRQELVNNIEVARPVSLEWNKADGDAQKLTERLYRHYLGGHQVDREHAYQFTRMMSDQHFNYGNDVLSQLNSQKSSLSTYRYELSYRGEMSLSDNLDTDIGKEWVCHGDDLYYLFRGGSLLLPLDPPSDDPRDLLTRDGLQLRKIILDLWTNFAATGNPTPDDSLGFVWEPTTPDELVHLDLHPEPTMKSDSRKEDRQFLATLPTELNRILYPNLSDDSRRTNEEL